ncbi:hypothetical protein [Neptuniibacter halophilus]|uniref:hypothetical protein n=1 Tax=Neptuniibacter halophilus TaxID=651666 RepID=UPI002573711F|nr:hypothetical protein [Neptuniibacter halophilus]
MKFKHIYLPIVGIFLSGCLAQPQKTDTPLMPEQEPRMAVAPVQKPPAPPKRDYSVPPAIKDEEMDLNSGEAVRISITR